MEVKFKFGDMVKDIQSNVESVIYRIDGDIVTTDTAYGNYGYNGVNVANTYNNPEKYLINLKRKDIKLAIKMQCHYALKDMERIIGLYENNEITEQEMNDLLFENHIFNIKSK